MNYEKEILCILVEAGDRGLSLNKIVMHVFNSRNGFFDVVSFEDVHRYVSNYLKRNCKSVGSAIEKTGKRGIYRLNPSSVASCQLQFNFKNEDENELKNDLHDEDQSLSLF